MEVDWDFFLTFPEDTPENTILPTNFFENNESRVLEDIITPPKSSKSFFNEPEEISIELPSQSPDIPNSIDNTYQYNLSMGDSFDDWVSVDTFIHNYCLERGFGYQISRNDKDSNNRSITLRKSYRCFYSSSYKARKNIDQDLHRS